MRWSKAELRACGYCLLFVLGEIGLYFSYQHHDARFHWFLHFFVGASTALLVMSALVWRNRRAVRLPLVWILAGHLFAMVPDGLFKFFGVIHREWMDVFLLHITAHFIPGRNLTWYAIFTASLALYLIVVVQRARLDLASQGADMNLITNEPPPV